MGLTSAVLVNLNGVVGAGIFALPALLYAAAGSFAPFTILIFAGFYACLSAIVAKLSTLFEQSGGPQLYAQQAFGNMAGFQLGWFHLSANMTGRAANMHVLVSYLAAIFPVFDGSVMRPVTIAVLIALFMTISIVGTERSIKALGFGTILKLAPIAALCIAGFYANGIPTDVALPQFSEIESVALLLAYAFSGVGTSTVAAGETKNPRTVIYRSIFVNLAVVAIIYAIIQLAYIAISPEVDQSDSPLAAAGHALFGPIGAALVSFAAVFSIATNQLNSFVITPRIMFGMARRGLLPNFLSHVSPRFQTPSAAIATFSLIAGGLALSGTFEILASLVVAVDQIILAACIAALITLWYRNDGGIADQMGLRWIPIIAVATAMTVWLSLQVPLRASVSTLMLVGIGFVLYFLSKRSAIAHEAIEIPTGKPPT